MENEMIVKFMEALQSDELLRKRMNEKLSGTAPEDRVEIVSEFATGEGYAFTAEEFREHEMKGQEVSDDELEAVSGGKRDWLSEGCSNTVEPGSWCATSDACYVFWVEYTHMPVHACPKCGDMMYYNGVEGNFRVNICKGCGYKEFVDNPYI